jgi:hypothetical protein
LQTLENTHILAREMNITPYQTGKVRSWKSETCANFQKISQVFWAKIFFCSKHYDCCIENNEDSKCWYSQGVWLVSTANRSNRAREEMLSKQHKQSYIFFEVCEMRFRVIYCQFDYTFHSVETVRWNSAGYITNFYSLAQHISWVTLIIKKIK